MTNKIVATRLITSILVVLMLGSVWRSPGQELALSKEDQEKIIESVFQLEVRAQNSEFESISNLSTENIDFVAPSRINGYFTLINADYILAAKVDHVIDYVVVRKIYSRFGTVFVNLSRVSEGRPCFAPAFSRERSFTYEYHKELGEWVGRLIGRKPRPFSAPWNWSVNGDRQSSKADPVFEPLRWIK